MFLTSSLFLRSWCLCCFSSFRPTPLVFLSCWATRDHLSLFKVGRGGQFLRWAWVGHAEGCEQKGMGWGRWLFLVPVGYVLGHWSPQLVFEQWVSPLWFRVWVKSCPVLAPCKEWQRLEARSHCYPFTTPEGGGICWSPLHYLLTPHPLPATFCSFPHLSPPPAQAQGTVSLCMDQSPCSPAPPLGASDHRCLAGLVLG